MKLTINQALQRGIEAHKAGNVREAEQYYTAILKANPENPDANHNMGVLAVGLGKVEAALPFFKTALEANTSMAQYWLSYIDALIKLSRFDEASDVLDKAKSNGAKGDGFDQLEKKLKEPANNKTKKGREVGNNPGMRQEPSQKQLQPLVNLYTQGQFKEALNSAYQLLPEFPRSLNLHNIIGASNKGIGNLEKAIEAYSKAISIQPDYADLYYNLGNALKDQGKLDEAIKAYNKALSIKPDYAEAWNNAGNALKEQGKLDEAINAYNKAISFKPDYAEAHNNMGVSLREQGKLSEAVEAYNKALSIKPDYAEASNSRGNALQEQGKLDEAIKAYNKALSIKPDYAEAWNNVGNALKEQGKLDEAIKAYNKALSIKPDYAEAHNNMGVSLQEQGKLSEAVEAYNKALSVKPDYAEVNNNMGASLQEQGKLDEAIEAYNKALSIKPDYAEAFNIKGNALQEQGKLDEAIKAYNKALSIKPDYAEAWNNLFFALQAIKICVRSDQNISLLYPKNINSKDVRVEMSILDYRLHHGQASKGSYFESAITSLANAENTLIQNQKFQKKPNMKMQALTNNMVVLVHFGRSGTGLIHSLIDGHPEVSTLPSIYFKEYFDHSTWLRIISGGWDGVIDRFVSIYEVLFDASSSIPVEGKSKKMIKNIGITDGMASVGDQQNEVLKVDKNLFKKELKRLMDCYSELDALVFFKLVHKAYDKALNDFNDKSLIFYHAHNPDTNAELNFARLNPKAKWLVMVREPIQSCESWIRGAFIDKDYFGVTNRILNMLFEIDNHIYIRHNTVGVRLEDLKINSQKTILALCKWMGIQENEQLYEMTAQGKKWWGDPNSPDYKRDGHEPFGKTSIERKVGLIFSKRDQLILSTLFYPFSLRFGYITENSEQFKENLQTIRPLLDQVFDFEKKIMGHASNETYNFINSGTYLYFRSGLIERWNTLNKFLTYPDMIRPLII